MDDKIQEILEQLNASLEWWVIHAKNAHQYGMIQGIQLSIQNVRNIQNHHLCTNSKKHPA